jgi:uncharacterized membrane protein
LCWEANQSNRPTLRARDRIKFGVAFPAQHDSIIEAALAIMATTVTTTMTTRTITIIIMVMATIFNAVIVSTFTCITRSKPFPLFATTNNDNNSKSVSESLSSSLEFRKITKITREEVEEEILLDNDPSTTLTTKTKTTVIKSVETDDDDDLNVDISINVNNDVVVVMEENRQQEQSNYTDNWNEMYDLLLKCSHHECHCNVPIDYYIIEDGSRKNLGQWLNCQRQLETQGTLDTRKEELLTNAGVIWEVVPPKQWERMFTLLEKYKHSNNGDCNVPRNYKEDGLNLGTWLSKQRLAKKEGIIDPVEQMRLEKLGIVWNTFSQQWDEKYNLLLQYKQREGNCRVPQKHRENNENLGAWLNKQRQIKKKGKLDDERLRKLEDIGVIWSFI